MHDIVMLAYGTYLVLVGVNFGYMSFGDVSVCFSVEKFVGFEVDFICF